MGKVESIGNFIKKKVREEVLEILRALALDYDLVVAVKDEEILIIIDEFYDYYQELGISFEFRKTMIDHFNDIAIMAVENESYVDRDFILEGLRLFEFCDSAVEVSSDGVCKVLKRINEKVLGGNNEE